MYSSRNTKQGRVTLRISLHIIILGIALLTGCGLFETRDPEPPTVRGSGFVPPTQPETVLANLQRAVAEKNSSDYLRCLVDTLSSERSYQFIPTGGAAARYPATFADWTLQSEQSYFANLVAFAPEGSPSSLVLTGEFDLLASDSAVYIAEYELTFRHGVADAPEVLTGSLQFTLATDRSNFWSIVKWTDLPKDTDPSWSDLKGRFAN